jgi:hypothetical protein
MYGYSVVSDGRIMGRITNWKGSTINGFILVPKIA